MSSKLQAISGYWVKVVVHSLGLATLAALSQSLESEAQVIPAFDGTGSQVRINGNQVHIYGGSLSSDEANLFHSLQQFGLTEDQIANFIATPNLDNIVTRIIGGDPSIINGVIQVTGGDPNLYLMNPSGVIFGANAQLNLPSSFVATTANGIQFGHLWLSAAGANNYENLVGNPTAFSFDANAGAIINAGNLVVNPQQSLLLLGGSVVNTGQLSAQEGQVLVTAIPERNVLHLQIPGNILTLEVEIPDELAAQPHAWTLPIASLPELLTSESVNPESLGLSVTNAGDVQLAGSNLQIPDQAGTAIVSGAIDVSGDRGGSVGVFGDLVGVADAQIDASGTFGGGTVLVGGEYQGQGTIPTADRTYVDSNSTIAADALTSGDGGRVIVWADGATAFYGGITARGGVNSGNGGFAEVSGQEYLVFDGIADLSSVAGETGILLFDPDKIIISNEPQTPGIIFYSEINPETGEEEIKIDSDQTPDIITISQNVIEQLSNDANIILEANSQIEIGNLNLVMISDFIGERPTLTFGNDVLFEVKQGDFIMMPDSVIRTLAGGNITIRAQDITTGLILADNPLGSAGSVNLNANQGDIVTNIRAITRNASESIIGNGGDITLTANNGEITVNENLVSFSANGSGGDINLTARNNININCGSNNSYCIETFAGGIEDIEPRGNSGNIRFISNEGSVIISDAATASNPASRTINAENAKGEAGNIRIEAPISIEISGVITSYGVGGGGAIDLISDQILLNGDLSISAGSRDNSNLGSINISGAIDGNFSLAIEDIINESSGFYGASVEIGGAIGSNLPLQSLLISEADTSLDNNIAVSGGDIVFNTPVNITNPITINANQGSINLNSNLSAGTNNLNLVANEINIVESISGSSSLVISATSAQGVDLGGDTISTDILNLSAAELSLINGFSNVIIDADTSPITISSPVTLNTPTQLVTTDDVNVNANITTLGQDLTFSSSVVLDSDVQISTGSGAGNLIFSGRIDGVNHDLTLEAGTGQVEFADAVDVNALNILSAQALLVETNITTNNTDLTFNIPVILTGGTVTLSTQTDGAGDIVFNNTLNSEANETNNLELTPGTGNVTFNGVVGETSSQRLGNITLGRFNTLTNNSTIRASSLQQTSGTLGQTATLSGNINTTGSGVNITTIGDITASDLTRAGGSTTLVSRNGSINVTNVAVTSGDFSAAANAGVTATTLNNQNGAVNLRSGTGNVQATDVSAAGDVAAISNTGVTASNIDSTGGAVNLSSGNSSVQATDISAAGNISAIAETDIVADNVNSTGGSVIAVANNGDVQVNNLTSNGDVTVTALGTITSTNGITSNGGDIVLNSSTRIETDELVSGGGNIGLSNSGNPTGSVIVNGDINASGAVNGGDVEIISEAAIDLTNTNINTSGGTGTGGNIALQSIDGRIAVNNLTTTGRTGGGNVSVIASELEDLAITLSIGEIDTSASIGDGGDVLLDPFGNIQVSFINAQGGTNGTGGDVTAITTGGLFRAIDSFIDQNGIDASISVAGGAGEGSISIFHNGGDLFIPFFVAFDGADISAATASGTVGALTTGNPAVNEDNIIENRVFPGTFVQDRIGIFTSDRFTLALDNALPDAEPDDPQLENADEQPFWLDEYFTRRTEAYLGLGFNTDVKSLEEIQEDLRRIEDATGVKPALIYAVFEPEEVLQTIVEGGPGSPDDLVNQGWLQRFREIGSDRLQLVLVTSEGQPIFRRPNDPEAIRDNIPNSVESFRRRILDDLDEYLQTGNGRPGRYLPEAQQLYAWLLEPLIDDLKQNQIDNLVFIMDTGLRSTPLAVLPAMHDGQSFVVENYSVGLMPSFSLTDTRYQNLANTGVEVLAMGMDNFNQYDEWKNLNAVYDEIRLITQQLWPSTETDLQKLLNDDFTLSNVYTERQSGNAGILHLATHTRFNPGAPQNSYIQLWNRRLRFSDLYDLGLNNPPIELLILSSCRTALSSEDESVELGFAGLSVQAGVKSSLASLWDVNDYGTLGLMVEFYSQLQNSTIKAEALRQAQLSMIRGQVFIDQDLLTWSTSSAQLYNGLPDRLVMSHPGLWSGFSIVGSPW